MARLDTSIFCHSNEFEGDPDTFLVSADRRTFAVMAFLNSVGYDDEATGEQMHPVRKEVRKLVAHNLRQAPRKLVEQWKAFYKNKGNSLPIYVYLDFALTLNGDYPFKRLQPDKKLTYQQCVKTLQNFPNILNEFWLAAKLSNVWEEVKPRYLDELHRYKLAKMQDELDFVWKYLRMSKADSTTLVNVPNLLDTHFQAIGAHYGNYFYQVESPGSHDYGLNIHEYLHTIINPLVLANYEPYKEKLQKYFEIGRSGELSKTYQDLGIFTYECLVRALDERIRQKMKNLPSGTEIRHADENIESISNNGLTLTAPFYHALERYEKSSKSFKDFLPVILAELK